MKTLEFAIGQRAKLPIESQWRSAKTKSTRKGIYQSDIGRSHDGEPVRRVVHRTSRTKPFGLANTKSADIVFVTDDEKSDWMVRSGGDALYPRFELIAEFHRESSQQLAIVNFVHFLELHDLSPDTVDKVRHSYAEGLSRFNRLRQRIFSILESLNRVVSDFFYSAERDEYDRIRDNRFDGLLAGFRQCYSAYCSIYGVGPALPYLQRFEEILGEMSTLNHGIEYEEVRMKRDTTEAESQLKRLCETFTEQWADFVAFTSSTPEW